MARESSLCFSCRTLACWQSNFSAARAHSRLHQVASLALRSISTRFKGVEQLDSVLLYLAGHAGRVTALELRNGSTSDCCIRELPGSLQLASLDIKGRMTLHLAPDYFFGGMLRSGAQLTRLTLMECTLLGGATGATGLGIALPLLPNLQHLSITSTLPQRQHGVSARCDITGAMLANMPKLTCLALGSATVEPAALAGKARLKHLQVDMEPGGPLMPAAALLLHLQHLTGLTHLCGVSLPVLEDRAPSAASYSALTASSQLRLLQLGLAQPPADVCKHIMPPGRVLPHLEVLALCFAQHVSPGTARVASCCPGLRELDVFQSSAHTAAQLAPLTGLKRLTKLHIRLPDDLGGSVLAEVAKLRELKVSTRSLAGVVQLMHLKQLTWLEVSREEPESDGDDSDALDDASDDNDFSFFVADEPGAPVWRQLLEHCLDFGTPADVHAAVSAVYEAVKEQPEGDDVEPVWEQVLGRFVAGSVMDDMPAAAHDVLTMLDALHRQELAQQQQQHTQELAQQQQQHTQELAQLRNRVAELEHLVEQALAGHVPCSANPSSLCQRGHAGLTQGC